MSAHMPYFPRQLSICYNPGYGRWQYGICIHPDKGPLKFPTAHAAQCGAPTEFAVQYDIVSLVRSTSVPQASPKISPSFCFICRKMWVSPGWSIAVKWRGISAR